MGGAAPTPLVPATIAPHRALQLASRRGGRGRMAVLWTESQVPDDSRRGEARRGGRVVDELDECPHVLGLLRTCIVVADGRLLLRMTC